MSGAFRFRFDALHAAHAARMRQMVQSAMPDLTNRQSAILLSVIEDGSGTIRSLAKRLDVGKPVVTRAVTALEAVELVRRVPDPLDRRSVTIVPGTAAGAYLRDLSRVLA